MRISIKGILVYQNEKGKKYCWFEDYALKRFNEGRTFSTKSFLKWCGKNNIIPEGTRD